MGKIEIPERELRKLYHKKGLKIKDIAKHFGCSKSVIWSRMYKYKIEHPGRKIVDIPKRELERLYLKEKMPQYKIAKLYNCAKFTIQNKMKKYRIPSRTASEAQKLAEKPSKYKIPKEELVDLYTKQKLSTHQIAKRYGTYSSVILHKLKKFGIKPRTVSEGIKLTNHHRLKAIAEAVTKYPKKRL